MLKYSLPMTSYLGRPECRPFFVCEPSSWQKWKTGKPGKTMSTARNEGRNLINLLRRSPHWFGAASLADCLMACQPEAPCLSGACPACNLAAQRAHVDLMGRALARTQVDMALATIIDSRRPVHVGQLGSVDLYREFRADLADVLTRFALPAIGGFELSQNWDEAERFRPQYVAQAHFALPGRDIKGLRSTLKIVFPPTRDVLKPVYITPYDGALSGAAYNHKNKLGKRIALMPMPGRKHSTKWRSVGVEGRVEVALAQHAAGLDANNFVTGFTLLEEIGRMRLRRLL